MNEKIKIQQKTFFLFSVFLLMMFCFLSGTVFARETPVLTLYSGEKIISTFGYPNLVKFINGDKNKPLIIFIPGNSHLARISYGFPGGNGNDFLAYWFHKNGYPFLAISYPLGNSIFQKSYPGYTIDDWSKSVAEIAYQTIRENNLSRNIVVVAWSMGGELAQRINTDTKNKDINIQLFVGLSASMPLYNLNPEGAFFEKLKPNTNGLANTEPFYSFFLNMLNEQNTINHHVIIPNNIYLSQFVGACPINIMGTALRYHSRKFVYNLLSAIKDTGAINVNDYPPIAIIHGNNVSDLNFTIFGKYDWGSLIVRHYYNALNACAKNDPVKLKKGIQIIKYSPNQLVETVDGTHFFFVGEYGAERTTDDIIKMIEVNQKIKNEIKSICDS